ncbi:MAG: hypothetical protein H8D23_27895 [Candidatus Brocadiales bacterium]|nr:hypothetical protein [Candidatus Brocadiales bacterium]
MMKPNIETEDFIKGYRFLRIPLAYAGEAFTKAHLLVYMLMKSKEGGNMRLYETSYTVPMTSAFINKAWEGLRLQGRSFVIENPHKIVEEMMDSSDKNKVVTTDLKKEFEADFTQVMEEILELQNEAKDRGWIVLLQEEED